MLAWAPVIDSPSRSSAERAPAVSPWARLCAASRRAVAAPPSALDAVDSISASSRASSRCSSGVSSSSLSPSSSRSSRVFSGSPSRFASGFPLAARERDRASDVIAEALCSVEGSTRERTSLSTAPSWRRFTASSSGRARSWRASSRSSSASSVRGSSASPPFDSRSSASSSRRSAWRLAASRTSRC